MKRKKLRFSYRMKYEDPWVVWSAFRSLRLKAIIYKDRDDPKAEDPDPWLTVDDIAPFIYENWNELSDHQKEMVRMCKLSMVVSFLRHHCWIVERYEMREKPKRYTDDWPEREQVYMKEYRARVGVFIGMESLDVETRVEWEKHSMNRSWYEYRGRPTTKQLLARAERLLEKA